MFTKQRGNILEKKYIFQVTMLQLIIMALLEIILYTINEFIGRKILFAFDVGDTIFLHMFAAMFGHNTSFK